MSRAKLIVFGMEIEATEGNVNGTLVGWQTDGDLRTRSQAVRTQLSQGQLWERAAA